VRGAQHTRHQRQLEQQRGRGARLPRRPEQQLPVDNIRRRGTVRQHHNNGEAAAVVECRKYPLELDSKTFTSDRYLPELQTREG